MIAIRRSALLASACILPISAAQAQSAGEPAGSQSAAASSGVATDDQMGVGDIIVTANKREEAVNTVPMSITAATGDQLTALGVTRARDLAKLTPGFTYAESSTGGPIYTLRGVGFSDNALGGRPTVSIYTDEVPIPFSIETRGGTNLDLERVEVLKGPQGTLFGSNATGGLINYVSAKPTDHPEAGLQVSYGRFNSLDVTGYGSGPLSDTLAVRIAFQHTSNDDWQRGYTIPDTNGAGNFNNGRILLRWTPTDRLTINLNVNGWIDRSDQQVPQVIAVTPSSPANAANVPGLLEYPLAPHNNRAADFTPGLDYRRDNRFVQASARVDYEVTDSVTLTSITAYSHYKHDQLYDVDGTTLRNLVNQIDGKIKSFSQELRAAVDLGGRGQLVLGGNYARDNVSELQTYDFSENSLAYSFVALGAPLFTGAQSPKHERENTKAIFANLDHEVLPNVKAHGGIRYTEFVDRYQGCSADLAGTGGAEGYGAYLNFLRSLADLGPNPPIQPNQCFTANSSFQPGLVRNTLREDNVSWRVGVDWSPSPRTLIYANISRGYKAGGFPTFAASFASSLDPTLQEALTAYEAGFKLGLFDRTLQLNGAAFYYDYKDKQILGRVLDPLFGPLLKLINIPKSSITGAEFQLTWAPVRGLQIAGGGTYIRSKIKNFTNFDPNGTFVDLDNQPFVNTPRWQAVGDISYEWSVNDNLNGFVGSNGTYQSATNSQLGNLPLYETKAYGLVDLRAGFETKSGTWRFMAWGRNVFNTYYWTASARNTDTSVRFTGMPATYGVTAAYRFR